MTGGLTHVWPFGTLRALAISSVTLGPGRTPPMPGLAPWLSFSETHLIASCDRLLAELLGVEAAVLGPGAEVAGADLPDDVAALEVVRDRPPSPVSWANPPLAAAWLSAVSGAPESAPKLIAETFSSAIS